MAETQGTTDRTQVRAMETREPSAWVGWILFAGTMLILLGTFQFIDGLVALFNSNYYLVTSNKLVVHANYTAWGWTLLVFGALSVAAGFGVMAGRTWARIYGIAVAFLSALVNLAFTAAYPVWSIIMVGLDIVVIWALAVHGREMRENA
jgi:hypothetical protein